MPIWLQVVLACLTPALAIVAIGLPIWRARRRHGLRWVILKPQSMMKIAEDVADHVEIRYRGNLVTDLVRYQFILHNTGRVPVERDDAVEALRWAGPGRIVSARVVHSSPPVALTLDAEEGDVVFSWQVFNQGCRALIEIVSEGASPGDTGEIGAQIRNIPAIEQKRVNLSDLEELAARFPLMSMIFLGVYVAGTGGLWAVQAEWMPRALRMLIGLAAAIGSLAFALVVVVRLWHLVYIPYSRLLASARRQRVGSSVGAAAEVAEEVVLAVTGKTLGTKGKEKSE